jgi:hypothetical protein
MSSQTPQETSNSRRTSTTTLVVTNLTKVAGLVIAINELIVRQGDPRTAAMALAAFMMTGAQVSERILLGAIDRFFGRAP